MAAQGLGRGKEGFKRRLFDVFRSWAFIAGIQVFVEISAEIDFVEWVGGGLLFQQLRRVGSDDGFGGGFGIAEGGEFDLCAVGFTILAIGLITGDFEDGLIGGISLALGFEQGLMLFGGQFLPAVGGFFENRVLS